MYDQYGFYSDNLPPGGPGGGGGHGGEPDVNFDFGGFDFGGSSGAAGGGSSFRDLFSQFFFGGRGSAGMVPGHGPGGDRDNQHYVEFLAVVPGSADKLYITTLVMCGCCPSKAA